MAAVLLTGAGFSFNWGGRLAKEVNTAIALRVQEDAHLADLLHRNPNFEEALTELQNACAISVRPRTAEQLRRLETAIVEVFADMNRVLKANGIKGTVTGLTTTAPKSVQATAKSAENCCDEPCKSPPCAPGEQIEICTCPDGSGGFKIHRCCVQRD